MTNSKSVFPPNPTKFDPSDEWLKKFPSLSKLDSTIQITNRTADPKLQLIDITPFLTNLERLKREADKSGTDIDTAAARQGIDLDEQSAHLQAMLAMLNEIRGINETVSDLNRIPRHTYSQTEAAQALGCGGDFVALEIKAGRLKTVTFSGHPRVPVSEIDRYVDELLSAPPSLRRRATKAKGKQSKTPGDDIRNAPLPVKAK